MALPRVVLDTNVLMSGLSYPGSKPGRIVSAWRHGELEVVLSHCILDELRRVLPRLRARHGLSDADIADLVDCPWDQAVLGTLVASRADHLVTGDKRLLSLAGKYPVIDPASFVLRCF